MGLSSFASKPIEDVIAANPKVFFQVYWLGGRDAIAERVERARQAGAVGLIVTTDWTFSHGRDWGSPKIPEEMNLRTSCGCPRRRSSGRDGCGSSARR